MRLKTRDTFVHRRLSETNGSLDMGLSKLRYGWSHYEKEQFLDSEGENTDVLPPVMNCISFI